MAKGWTTIFSSISVCFNHTRELAKSAEYF